MSNVIKQPTDLKAQWEEAFTELNKHLVSCLVPGNINQFEILNASRLSLRIL